MNTTVIHNTLTACEAGQLTFPQAVQALTAVGVESYLVDLASGSATYYMHDGRTHTEPLTHPAKAISQHFDAPGIISAIRKAQTDQLRYPEFLDLSIAAGTIAYWAFLAGRKVIYYGREGEFHVEEFPKPAH